jgi:hypothetical protein
MGWDAVSIICGILIGFIIAAIFVAIMYSSRSAIFYFCPSASTSQECLFDNYWSDPGNALAQNSSLTASDILFIDNNELMYKRQPKTALCTPNPLDQTVPIDYPQYCQFSTSGAATFTGKSSGFNAAFYTGTLSTGESVNVYSKPNCVPIRSETNPCPDPTTCNIVVSGTPLVQWDPSSRLTETTAVVPPFTFGP